MKPESKKSLDDRPRVVIVGGGLAGMSAAESLARCGNNRFNIVVLEAKRNTGGRAGSFQDPSSHETVDYCQHVAMGCCTNLIGLLKRCGQLDQWNRESELKFLFAGKPPTRFLPSRFLPPPFHLLGTLLGIRYLRWNQVLSIANAMWRLMRTSTSQLQNVTASDWLIRNGQDATARERFWGVILVSALGENCDAVSMAAARKVIVDGFAGARGAADILIPGKPLSVLFGQQLAETLRGIGVTIQTESIVSDMIPTDDGRVAVHANNNKPLIADHVIVATAWHNSAKLLANHLPRTTIDEFSRIGSSPISGVHLWFDRELTDRAHAVIVGGLSQWLFRPSRSTAPATREFYYQVVISGSAGLRDKPKAELVDTVVAELQQFFPATRDAKLIRSRVVTDPNSVFSVRPEIETLRPDASTTLPWLHLAGDWIATGWPSTMEGAVISGRMAANSVLERLNFDSVVIDSGLSRGLLARILIKN